MSKRHRRQLDPGKILPRVFGTSDLEKRLTDACQRLQDQGARIVLEMDTGHAIAVVAELQLALRHPLNHGPTARQAREVADAIIQMLERGEPAIGPILRMGYNPVHDVRGGG